MAITYGLMAGVCVIETFGYMTSATKYLAIGVGVFGLYSYSAFVV